MSSVISRELETKTDGRGGRQNVRSKSSSGHGLVLKKAIATLNIGAAVERWLSESRRTE